MSASPPGTISFPNRRSSQATPSVGALDEASRGRLALLRICAVECRAARRLGLPEARAQLAACSEVDAPAYAEALVRTLPEALGRRLEIRQPGATTPSFDEAWMLALLAATDRRDAPSVAFLLRSRAMPRSWSSLATLAGGLSRAGAGLDTSAAAAI